MRTNTWRVLTVAVMLVSVGNRTMAEEASRSFQTVDCESFMSAGGELLFLTSQHGFIQDRRSGSYLQKTIPNKVAGAAGIPGQTSVQTVVVQAVPTEDLGFNRLEGGIPGQSLFVVLGGVLGLLLAPAFRRNPAIWAVGGLLAGYLASIVVMDGLFECCKNDMTLTVDNACNTEVTVSIGAHDPLAVPAKSQITLGIEESNKHVLLRETGGDRRTDSFILCASKSLDHEGKAKPSGYVLNVFGENSYRIEHAAYSPDR